MEQGGGNAIGGQRGPFRFEVEQFRAGAFRQKRSQRAKCLLLMFLAGALSPARIGNRDDPEEGAERRQFTLFKFTVPLTVRTGLTFLEVGGDLVLNHRRLKGMQNLFALLQR